jgi:hypothetical protein
MHCCNARRERRRFRGENERRHLRLPILHIADVCTLKIHYVVAVPDNYLNFSER